MPWLLVIFVPAAAAFVWGFFIEPRFFETTRCRVTLHKPLHRPVRFLHLSDIHFSGRQAHLDRLFDRLAREPLDFVMVSGDIIDCASGIRACVENLKKLKPAGGIFAVFGNHDHYDYRLLDVFFRHIPGQGTPANVQRADLLEEALRQAGIRVLKNQTLRVEKDGEAFLIHGLDDPVTGHADLGRVMPHLDPSVINILLTHTVDVFLYLGENEIDLSFSGHSHGGQIKFPFIGPVITHTRIGREYVSGVRRLKGAVCSISRGVGASRFFPARFLCRPQVILLDVHGKREADKT